MKLLLTGQPHAGKSTLLNKVLRGIKNKQGFITSEIAKDGQRVGFELVSSQGKRVHFADVDSTCKIRVSRYGVDVRSLDGFIDELPKVDQNALLYIDEIGQMQLFSDKFKKLAIAYIESNNNLIGTISKVYDHEFVNQLKNDGGIEIIEVTPANRDQLAIDILAKLKRSI